MEITSLIIAIVSLLISTLLAIKQLKYTRNQDKLNSLLKDNVGVGRKQPQIAG